MQKNLEPARGFQNGSSFVGRSSRQLVIVDKIAERINQDTGSSIRTMRSGPDKRWRSGIPGGLTGFVCALLVIHGARSGGGVSSQRMQDVLKGSNGGVSSSSSSSSEVLVEWGCPAKCSCLGDYIKCSGLGLKTVPVTSDYFTKL